MLWANGQLVEKLEEEAPEDGEEAPEDGPEELDDDDEDDEDADEEEEAVRPALLPPITHAPITATC